MLLRCSQFGFDREKINQRLASLRLSKADHKLAQCLNREVIAPHVNEIVEHFYDALLFHSENQKWLRNDEIVKHVKQTQQKYLLSLGIDFDSEAYFENRLHIGIIHAVIDLPLGIYQSAYSNLIQYIIALFPESIRKNYSDNLALTNFVIKITSLDISLAIETYHHSFMADLEDEVETAHSRESKLKNLAETDSLTGLYNRKYIFSHLNKAIGNAHQYSADLCLLMLDIDHFKKVNDTYGHQAGDEVLKQVAVTITKTMRDRDIVGRYGGEEFILGLINITSEHAKRIAERIRNTIADTPISINEQVIQITVSIGLACLDMEDDLKGLIKRADMALYSAKESGRNCVICS